MYIVIMLLDCVCWWETSRKCGNKTNCFTRSLVLLLALYLNIHCRVIQGRLMVILTIMMHVAGVSNDQLAGRAVNIDTCEPKSKEDFDRFEELLREKITKYEVSKSMGFDVWVVGRALELNLINYVCLCYCYNEIWILLWLNLFTLGL